jgi:hypothetical protein
MKYLANKNLKEENVMRKSLPLLVVIGLLFIAATMALAQKEAMQTSTNDFAAEPFAQVWQRTDLPLAAGVEGLQPRSWMWGPSPITAGVQEAYAEGAGGTRLVQYFDKSRMELNDPSTGYVTNGLLVMEMIEGRIQVGETTFEERTPSEQSVAGDPADSNPNAPTYRSFRSVAFPVHAQPAPDRTGAVVTEVLAKDGSLSNNEALAGHNVTIGAYNADTGHNIAQVFIDAFARQGIIYENGSYQQGQIANMTFAAGLPISDPYWARVQVGGVEKDVLVQAFQRRVLTYTPDNDPDWRVEMGNVGQHYLAWRYEGTTPPAAAQPAPTTATQPGNRGGDTGATSTIIGDGSHIVVDIQGGASFRRATWSEHAPLFVGTSLGNGDVLKLAEQAQVTIVCAGLYAVTVTPGSGDVACNAQAPVLPAAEDINPTRGASVQAQVLISPRKTTLLNPRPTIYWQNTEQVTVNEIGITGSGVDWSRPVEAWQNQLAYPDNEPELQAGGSYRVILSASGGDVEPTVDLGFSMLADSTAQVVRSEEARIQAMSINELAKNLLVAELYTSHGLYAEALELLQNSAGAGQTVKGLLLQGTILLETDLDVHAIDYFQQALTLAQNNGDSEGQAEAYYLLGKTHNVLGDKQAAATHLQQALAIYQQLGDSVKVEKIQTLLGSL